MTDARCKEVGICAGPGLSRELPMDVGSTHAHKDGKNLKCYMLNNTTQYLFCNCLLVQLMN